MPTSKKRPILDPNKIPGMKEGWPAPTNVYYNGYTYDLSDPAHLRAYKKDLPPPGAQPPTGKSPDA